MLGTQETLCYLVAGLFERDHLHPTPLMVMHLREICYYPTKTLRLEAQHESTRISCVVDIKLFSSVVVGEVSA